MLQVILRVPTKTKCCGMISIFLLHINSLMLYREEDEEEVDLQTIKFPKSVVNCNYKSIGNYISFCTS